jgi:branched-chain amino acid transport system permease protein
MLSRKLLGNPLAFMIGSIGLAIFIQEVMRISSGSANIWIPSLFEGQSMISFTGTFPVRFGTMSAIHVAASVAAVLAACWFIFKTPFGLHWRACAQNPRLASLCGIDAAHVAMLTFAISGALAGVTGWSSAIAYGGANFSSGLMAGFKAMFASVIGGFGTVKGAVAGALLLAMVEVVWSAYYSASYRDVVVFGLIIIALVFRPEGLFGMWNDVRLARGEES